MTKKILYILVSVICGVVADSLVASWLHNNLVSFVIGIIVAIAVYPNISFISRKFLDKGTESITNSKILAKMKAKEEARQQQLEIEVTFMPYVAWKDGNGKSSIAHIQYGPVTVNPNTGEEFNFVDYLVRHQSDLYLKVNLNDFLKDVDNVKQLKKAFGLPTGYFSKGAFTPVYALNKCPEYDKFRHLFSVDSFRETFSSARRAESSMEFGAFVLGHTESPFFDRYMPWDKFVQIGGMHFDCIIVHQNAISSEELAKLDVDAALISYSSDPA